MRVLDPEGAHLAALRRLAGFRGRRVLELGCGDGRLTVGIAVDTAQVMAFDSDAAAVERARRSLPAGYAARVEYRVASERRYRSSAEPSTWPCSPGHFDEWNPRTS